MSNPIVEFLLSRRSVVAKAMLPTPPSAEHLEEILKVGMRVPDHGKLTPWKIVKIEGSARRQFGEQVLAPAFIKNQRDDATDATIELERNRFARAGIVLAVLFDAQVVKKVPLWEMELSSGAVCSHLLIAAQSYGYAAQWLTEWCAFDTDVLTALGGDPSKDRVAGFIYIGEKVEEPADRARPETKDIVSSWPFA